MGQTAVFKRKSHAFEDFLKYKTQKLLLIFKCKSVLDCV